MHDLTNLFRHAPNITSFSAGDVILKEGDSGDIAYVVLEGEVEVTAHGKHLDTAGPGSIVGEMALIDHEYRSATVTAKTDCKLAPIDQKQFMFMVQETPYFAIQVMHIMADRVRKLHE